jgi:hypothetical protein
MSKLSVGKRVKIIATNHPQHAVMVGRGGTILGYIKSRNVYRILLDAPVQGFPKSWEAFPKNCEVQA